MLLDVFAECCNCQRVGLSIFENAYPDIKIRVISYGEMICPNCGAADWMINIKVAKSKEIVIESSIEKE